MNPPYHWLPRKTGVLLLLSVLGVLPMAARDPQERLSQGSPLSQREPLFVGAFSDAYPYSYIDDEGHLAGFTVDILDAVARASNLSIKRIVGRSASITESFQKGEFDLLQHHGITIERKEYAEFSVPFLDIQGGIFIKEAGPVRIEADLVGKAFGVVSNVAVGERFLRERHIKARVVAFSTAEEMLRHLEDGGIAGVFLSRLTAITLSERLKFHDIVMLGQPVEGYEIHQAFAVHPGDAELLSRLNEGLAIIHRTGEYERIYRKNFGQFGSYILSGSELELIASAVLAAAFVASLWGYLRQRKLRKELVLQAAKLAEQGALLQALYDNIPMAMTVVETAPSGARVLAMNRQACAMYGLSDPPKGETLASLGVSEEVRQHLLVAVTPDPDGGPVTTREANLPVGKRLLEITAVALATLDTPDTSRMCVLVEDVTDRMQKDAEIARSRKLRAVGELVGGIAHEFNNLLTPVMLKAGEIQMYRPDDNVLQQDIDVIIQAVQRTAELTRRLLTFGRKVDHRSEAVRIDELVSSCFDLLKNTIDRRITWSSSIPSGLPPLYFNGTDLNQILLNLLLNARDTLLEKLEGRSDQGWTPRISVDADALPAEAFELTGRTKGRHLLGWQRLTVSDNGVGMPPDVVERIFEPFFTTKVVGKGTGLGLATVWHLVTEAGGHVKVDSKLGVGSTFHVFLPVWPIAEAPGRKRSLSQPVRPSSVLLVEDEELVARTMTDILKRNGHKVRHIGDGLEAWRHLSNENRDYDLLVIDVNLPGMNGVEVVARLREKHFAGRILMVSGRFTPNDMHALTRLRIDHSLTKPFDVPQFVEAVNESLEAERV